MVDWGFIIALSIGIALLAAAVVWAVWWFKRVMPALKDTITDIAKHFKR
jgi:ferric-dicitrate binding protein FerR (iron transport regulator)